MEKHKKPLKQPELSMKENFPNFFQRMLSEMKKINGNFILMTKTTSDIKKGNLIKLQSDS